MLYILGFNAVWGIFCLLEKFGITKTFLTGRSNFEITEIWFGVALVLSFFIFALMPKRDKRIESYTCPHCGAKFKGGLMPTFCQACKAAIEQPKFDADGKYYKGDKNARP